VKNQNYELIISPEAVEEFNASIEFYKSKKENLDIEFVNEIEKTLDRIVANPEQFPKVKQKPIRKALVNRFPFGIYFAQKDSIINVLAIFNFSRNPKRLKKRF